jgi:ELWxxDGT repeat protein
LRRGCGAGHLCPVIASRFYPHLIFFRIPLPKPIATTKKLYALLLFWLTLTTATAQFTLVKDFNGADLGSFEPFDTFTLFRSNGIWRSNGTAAGTFLLTTASQWDPRSAYRCRGENFVFWFDNGGQQQLWKSDGTVAGTVMVKQLPRTGRGFTAALVNVNGLALFGFNTAENGTEIWRSDGTDAGTQMVTDLIPGSGDGYAYPSRQSSVLDGYFYFWGPSHWDGTCNGECRNDGSNYYYRPALYRTDGTAAGTTRVANGGFGPHAGGMNVINGKLIYKAYYTYTLTFGPPCSSQTTLTPATATVLMQVENGVGSVLKYPVTVVGCGGYVSYGNTFVAPKFVKSSNYLYFTGQTEGSGSVYNLWRTDGTTDGTIPLTNFATGSGEGLPPLGSITNDSDGNSDFNFTNLAYFPIQTAAAGAELWRTDGTVAGTYLLKDILPGVNGSNPTDFRTVNGTTYFYANDGTNGLEPWKTDGTAAGTQLVQDLKAGSTGQGELGGNDHYNNTSVGMTYFTVGVAPSYPTRSGLFALNVDGFALPVRLLYFSGGVINQQTQLAWATTLETDNEGFAILKSRDALGWESVGFVPGKGESNQRQAYSFTDADVRPGQVWYYKLRQRDRSGKTEDSKVIAIKIEAGAGRSLPYPNPSPDGSFRLTAQAAQGQTVRLFTLTGQEIAVQSQPIADEVLVTPWQSLATGAYVVKLTDDAGATRVFTLVVER